MRNRVLPALTFTAALFAPTIGAAHGTDEPGPHGGEIRMPGAFHVEVVAQGDAVRLYLLDMEFEQPRVANSSVEAVLEQSERTIELDCTTAEDAKAFTCPLPKGASLQRGTLKIDATRQGNPASTARYELPLDWQDGQGESTG